MKKTYILVIILIMMTMTLSANIINDNTQTNNNNEEVIFTTVTLSITTTLSNTSYYGTVICDLINPANGNIQTFTSSNGIITASVSSGVYDMNVYHNSDNYERKEYRAYNLNNSINNFSISLIYNPDKTIIVPDDYSSVNEAISRIQNNGKVQLRNNYYQIDPWKYKKLKIESIGSLVTVSRLELSGSNFDNNVVLKGLTFQNLISHDPWSPGGALSLKNGASPIVENCSFINNEISFTSYSTLPAPESKYHIGGAVFIEGINNQTNTPIFKNCIFTDNKISGGHGGGAVGLYGQAQFTDCTFTGNMVQSTLGNDSYDGLTAGGAVLGCLQTVSGEILFRNCQFNNNLANLYASDVYIIRADNIQKINFDNCGFSNNVFYGMEKPAVKIFTEESSYLLVSSNAQIQITNNTFKDQIFGGIDIVEKYALNRITVKNNVFYNISNTGGYGLRIATKGGSSTNPQPVIINQNTFKSIVGRGIQFYNGRYYTVENCAFENCSTYGIDWSYQTDGLTLKYCYFTSDYNDVDHESGAFSKQHIIYDANQNISSTNFAPIWSRSVKSICIDNGNPDNDGDGLQWYQDADDRETDGTRMDIGAIPTLSHGAFAHKIYKTTNSNYSWICFPYVDKRYTATSLYDVDQLYYLFQTYHDNNLMNTTPQVLNRIMWFYNTLTTSICNYYFGNWQLYNSEVKSQYGYKVELVDSQLNLPSLILDTAGFLCGTSGNSDQTIHIDAKPAGSAYREIWVGYFKVESERPTIALSQVIDQLIEIKTQKWCMSRANTSLPWTYSAQDPFFNFGEAVVLKYVGTSAINFTWQTLSFFPSFSYSEQTPQYFTYEEQADYTPIYVQLNPNNSKSNINGAELALFINDKCYGAEVVVGDVVQINAYIEGVDLNNAEVEFRYWEPAMKGNSKKLNQYAVLNNETNQFESRMIEFNDQQSFYTVSFKTNDIENGRYPQKSSLSGNYPNPFNPETTIKYALAEQGNVKLDIYNSKGQLVKTLVNDVQTPGFKSVIWNGKDNQGKKVSSGIYFYRLDTKTEKLTKKMLLMK